MGHNVFYSWWWKFEVEFTDQLCLSTLCTVSHLIPSQILMYFLYGMLSTTQTQLHWLLAVVFFQLYRPDWLHLDGKGCLKTGDRGNNIQHLVFKVGAQILRAVHIDKDHFGWLHYLDSSIGELLFSALSSTCSLPRTVHTASTASTNKGRL